MKKALHGAGSFFPVFATIEKEQISRRKGTKPLDTLSNRVATGSSPTADEDYSLVLRCQRGDVDAFEELVVKYQKKMVNLAYRMTDNYHDACDIVQDAFIAAYREIRGFQGKSRFVTWLSTITMNLARNRLKQVKTEQSRQGFSLDAPVLMEDGEVRMEVAANTPSALEMLEKRDVQKSVQDCINALDDEFRTVVVLREMQGFAYDEISEMLQTAMGTVKSRLFRAREMLKNCLKGKLGEL